ncbi:ribosomal protein S5 domain 2-type protein [Tribonema minus]|uniref:Ribosomal RNA-processing protein 42 n=1 Tax=Tribonema minus TaxID=303371 RepID=A0A835YWB1_9STRA|nr:ribosomal protein S5 domain 2-type protein [Tribonema minus]
MRPLGGVQDGRGWLDYRSISVQGEVLPQANGSARITIAHGGTEVLAAVKIETGVPSADAPHEGRVEVCVECSNSLFPTFDDRSGGDVNAALSLMLARTVVESGALDLKSLCIIPGRFCWIVYLDVLVLQADGNLLDAASFAAYVAFNTALVPRTTVISGEGAGVEDDFEIDGDLNTATRLPGADKVHEQLHLDQVQTVQLFVTT